MEGRLIKTGDQFLLRNKEDEVIAITSGTMGGRMLSLKNCQAIELGYDLDELALIHVNDHLIKGTDEYHNSQVDFKEGFQKAVELLGDKKFSEDDIKKAIHFGASWREQLFNGTTKTSELFESLQQTEWNVEIEMECPECQDWGYVYECRKDCGKKFLEPKLDADGCLILKRK